MAELYRHSYSPGCHKTSQLKTLLSVKKYLSESDLDMHDILRAIQIGPLQVPLTKETIQNELLKKHKEKELLDYLKSIDSKSNKEAHNTIKMAKDEYKQKELYNKKEKLISKMKEKYGIDLVDRGHTLPNEEFQARTQQYEQIINEEIERLKEYVYLKHCVLNKLKKRLKQDKSLTEKEFDKFIEKIMDELEKEEENCPKELRRTLVRLIQKLKKKQDKICGGYEDEQCETCIKLEKDWENDRITADYGAEPLTEEDARLFHSRLVRSGGMQCLVHHFRDILEADVQPEAAFPFFLCSMAQPKNSERLIKLLRFYHGFHAILEELKEKHKEINTVKTSPWLEDSSTTSEKDDEPCFFCKNGCDKHNCDGEQK